MEMVANVVKDLYAHRAQGELACIFMMAQLKQAIER